MTERFGRNEALIKSAGDYWRGIASYKKASVDALKGKGLLNPVTRFRSLRSRWELRTANRNIKLEEENARDYLDLLDIHRSSSAASEFYDQVSARAQTHEMTDVLQTLDLVRTLDTPSLYELVTSDDWQQRPAGARAAFEIAIALAMATKQSGSRNEMELTKGKGAEDWNVYSHWSAGVDYERLKGIRAPDKSAVSDVYKLLGMDDEIDDIPEIPIFDDRLPQSLSTHHKLDDMGLSLTFIYNSARTEYAAGGKMSYLPAQINLAISAKAR